jgi:hypothetical protein
MPLTRSQLRTPALALALLAAWVLFAAPRVTRAQIPGSLPVTPEIKSFGTKYVAALNTKDTTKLWSYLAPETRACVTPQNKDFYNAIFGSQMDDTIPPDYKLELLPVNEGNVKAMSDFAYFPVKPVHQLQIDYQTGNSGGSIILYLVRENGSWFAGQPCSKESAIQEFREAAPDRAHYRDFASQIKDPLRSELLKLIATGDTPTAIDKYKSATGSDMRTSMQVLHALKISTQPLPPPLPVN